MLRNVFKVLRHKGPAGLVKAVYYALKIYLFRDVFGRRHMRKQIHGSWMDLDLRDRGISRTLLLFGTREEEHRLILNRVLRDGMTIFDIGANIGYYRRLGFSVHDGADVSHYYYYPDYAYSGDYYCDYRHGDDI